MKKSYVVLLSVYYAYWEQCCHNTRISVVGTNTNKMDFSIWLYEDKKIFYKIKLMLIVNANKSFK